MKKLKYKKGFTLVECIVAMAVLAIMSLILMMILNITVLQRNKNMSVERDIDEQINLLAIGSESSAAMPQFEEIEFIQGTSVIETIPPNDVKGVVANKVHYSGKGDELEVITYNFDNYQIFNDIINGETGTETGGTSANDPKAYGGASLTSLVNITGFETELKKNSSQPDLVTDYSIRLEVKFHVSSGSPEKGLKIKLPKGSYNIGYDEALSSNVFSVYPLSGEAVRIQPADGTKETFPTDPPTTTTNPHTVCVTAYITFMISKEDYDTNYVKTGKFYGNNDSYSAEISVPITSTTPKETSKN